MSVASLIDLVNAVPPFVFDCRFRTQAEEGQFDIQAGLKYRDEALDEAIEALDDRAMTIALFPNSASKLTENVLQEPRATSIARGHGCQIEKYWNTTLPLKWIRAPFFKFPALFYLLQLAVKK